MNMDKFNRKKLVQRLAERTGATRFDLNRATLFVSNGLVPRDFSFVESLCVAAVDSRNDELVNLIKAVQVRAATKDLAA